MPGRPRLDAIRDRTVLESRSFLLPHDRIDGISCSRNRRPPARRITSYNVCYTKLLRLLYLLAYFIMMHILRLKDSVQHDYGSNPTLFVENPPSRYGGRASEQAHTFSNPECLRYDWPNYFTLCFGFHNAHHHRPTVPWYRLPEHHRKTFGNDPRITSYNVCYTKLLR